MSEVAQPAPIFTVLNRQKLARYSDWLAVAVAVSLPWSTTASGILIALWLVVILPTIDLASLRCSLTSAAAFFPVVLFAFAVLGMTWGEAAFFERLAGIKVFVRLLVIVLLLIQFQRSDRGFWVVGGFLVSCAVMLLASWTLFLFPAIPWKTEILGVPTKDYVIQSGEFLLCAFALAHLALCAWNGCRPWLSLGLAGLGLLFVANIAFVATGRSTLVALGVLVIVLIAQRFHFKGAVILIGACAVFIVGALTLSPYLRARVAAPITEISAYRTDGAATSSGLRLEFWRKSVDFVARAPLFGHGMGSTKELFRNAAVGDKGVSSVVTDNPHQQTLDVALPLGLVGVALLYAMWISHLMLFHGSGLSNWIGLGVVVHSIVFCLFNSYLFEFTLGWIYIFGVGVLGGMALRSGGQLREPSGDAART